MPIYEYKASEPDKGCDHCRNGFEQLLKRAGEKVEFCPKCGTRVEKQVCAPFVGASKSGFDARARNSGFHKLQRAGKGEYEVKY